MIDAVKFLSILSFVENFFTSLLLTLFHFIQFGVLGDGNPVARPVSIKHGLRTADYGLRTGYKIRTRYKTRTRKYGLGIKHGQGIKRGLRTADWV